MRNSICRITQHSRTLQWISCSVGGKRMRREEGRKARRSAQHFHFPTNHRRSSEGASEDTEREVSGTLSVDRCLSLLPALADKSIKGTTSPNLGDLARKAAKGAAQILSTEVEKDGRGPSCVPSAFRRSLVLASVKLTLDSESK